MKKKEAKLEPDIVSLPLVHPRAAGIDVGDKVHSVAIPEGIFCERVKTFGSMTCDLEAIANWLFPGKDYHRSYKEHRGLLETAF